MKKDPFDHEHNVVPTSTMNVTHDHHPDGNHHHSHHRSFSCSYPLLQKRKQKIMKNHHSVTKHCSSTSSFTIPSPPRPTPILSPSSLQHSSPSPSATTKTTTTSSDVSFHDTTVVQEMMDIIKSQSPKSLKQQLVKKTLEAARLKLELEALKAEIESNTRQQQRQDQDDRSCTCDNKQTLQESSQHPHDSREDRTVDTSIVSSYQQAASSTTMESLYSSLSPSRQEQQQRDTLFNFEQTLLYRKCASLERAIEKLQQQQAMKEAQHYVTLRGVRLMVEQLQDDRHFLQEKYDRLEGKYVDLCMRHASKQARVDCLEKELDITMKRIIHCQEQETVSSLGASESDIVQEGSV